MIVAVVGSVVVARRARLMLDDAGNPEHSDGDEPDCHDRPELRADPCSALRP
jgi:hypothetical protein